MGPAGAVPPSRPTCTAPDGRFVLGVGRGLPAVTHAVTPHATWPTTGGALVPAHDGGERRPVRLGAA